MIICVFNPKNTWHFIHLVIEIEIVDKMSKMCEFCIIPKKNFFIIQWD